ncbi:LacI family DNA-binding transcriptional regulator [Xanthobacteraceae bacterium Astr-EGSB]|uniref:LacI family DNA-binding transcriptional regulator n=1 Tax=Astrobacterium formosum TaxID=3069710 RepID=UPI0027B4A561|nr:LacI family DNA-binding transcriptional regulator [Xanthobacteraceae bacterium Astr-EGSB]
MGHETTLKDLARALDLSISTVARALSDHPQISEQTKARVRAAASVSGYVAHSAARAMRRGHSTLIGLIIPDVENEFYGTLAKGLAQCCDQAGFQMLLAITEDDPVSEERQVRALSEARVAGFVVVPSPKPLRATFGLLARGPCVQLIRRLDELAAPWFGIDEEAALREATGHLLGQGHRRIAYVGGSLDLSTGRGRLRGFEQAFEAAGLSVPHHLVRLGRPRRDFASDAFSSLWGQPEQPTAVVTGGARLCAGVLEVLGRMGLKIPADISVVGFGDAPWWYTALTTISLPAREIAIASGEFLLRRIRDGRREADSQNTPVYQAIHRSSLVLRASTAPVGT